jgi:hypothetical protein
MTIDKKRILKKGRYVGFTVAEASEIRRLQRLTRRGKLEATYELALVDTDGLTQFMRLDLFPFIGRTAANLEMYLRHNMGLDADIIGPDTSSGHFGYDPSAPRRTQYDE